MIINLYFYFQQDLIDFTLDSHRIFTLSSTPTTSPIVQSQSFAPPSGQWQTCPLATPPDGETTPLDPALEPREAYVAHIFTPGRFPPAVIAKALGIYRRSAVPTETNVSLQVLRQRVCQAVETEVRNEVREFEVTDMDYLEVTNR